MIKTTLPAALLAALAAVGCACGDCYDDADSTTQPVRLLPVSASETATTAPKDLVDTAVAAGDFGTLATALRAADLIEALKGQGPFTVFAPTDAAFAKVDQKTLAGLLKPENKAALTSVLTYHVVPGRVAAADVIKLKNATTLNGQRLDIRAGKDGVFIDGAQVVTTDIEASNGLIHVIDSVVLPASDDLVDTAVGAGSFSTLVAAVKAAGLVETLKGKGPLTVFAPTDEAFAKLPAGTVEDLLKPENKDRLVKILTHHVVAGRVYSDQALRAGKAGTVAGTSLDIVAADGNVSIGGAGLVSADIEASNGVIHVIDSVMLP